MMKKKLPVWLLWPFAVFLLGIWHLLDVRASVTETGHHWLYGWYGGLFFVSMVILVGFGVLIFGKNWGFFDSVSSRCGNALVLKKELEAMEHLSEENQYLHKREAFLCNQLINQTELFNKLKTTKYIDDQLWQEIKEKIDLLFDNYTKRLCHQIPSLTDGDIQICCLIKLRFSNGDIANMLAISPTSVSKRKLRLKERIVQEIGSLGENQSLDLWLMEY
jgi:DNA-binding CsgD family transcriptional regulator